MQIKYRDSLNILLTVREKQRKGEDVRDRSKCDDVASLRASLDDKERALEMERRRVNELSNRHTRPRRRLTALIMILNASACRSSLAKHAARN